jgi:hypothetical protein
VSFATITLCVASQRVFIVDIVDVYFVIDSVRKFLDTPSYITIIPVPQIVMDVWCWIIHIMHDPRNVLFLFFLLVFFFCV